MRDDLNLGVELDEPLLGGLQLRAADVGSAVEDLALDVGEVDDVEVDDADPPHTGSSEIERQGRAEPAGADAEDLGALQALLPGEGQRVSANSSRPISMRRISLVPAPIS